jgi:broad specificity phosphatase PhoE
MGTNTETTSIYLVRHGECEYNKLYASGMRGMILPDSPLTDKGIIQSRKIREQLLDIEPTIIVSSAMLRTMQTAYNALPFRWRKKIRVTPSIIEQLTEGCDLGTDIIALRKMFPDTSFSFLGNTWGIESAKISPRHVKSIGDLHTFVRENHIVESDEEFISRVAHFKAYLKSIKGEKIVIFGHREFFKELIKQWEDKTYKMSNAEIYLLTKDI